MKLRALDQVHVSSVQADSLRPGQEFEVSDALGAQMLKSLPGRLERVAEHQPSEKSEQDHPNKAIAAAPANKAKPKGKSKAD